MKNPFKEDIQICTKFQNQSLHVSNVWQLVKNSRVVDFVPVVS